MNKKEKVVAKIDHSSSRDKEVSNSRNWIDFLDQETLNIFPGRDDWRGRLIHTMLKWAEKETSLEIMQFCIEYKIPYTTLREWDKKYEDVRKAYAFMKLMIACHRRVGSMNKKLDGAYAYKDMHCYDPEWHDVNKYHSDLKKEEEKQAHTFIINDIKPRIVTKEELSEEVSL